MFLLFRIAGITFRPTLQAGASVNFQGHLDQVVTLVHGEPNKLSVIRNLHSTDVIVLLTPVVIPVSHDPGDLTDPFECFGDAMRTRHPRIRHVPYTNRNGITSTHVGVIKRATVVIFVISEAPRPGDAPQIDAAHVTQVLAEERPLLIVLTCSSQHLQQLSKDFPTIIQSKDYTKPTLEKTVSFIFGEDVETPAPPSRPLTTHHTPPKLWPVEQWNESRDIDTVYDLWTQNMDVRFAMHITTLAALLRRPGYATHYIVRDASGQVLGFCATFLSYVDLAGEKLIASLAILLVDLEHRHQGIGLSLHNYAVDHLKRTRGVGRLQLGSTFPRILYGPPSSMEFDQVWFSRRGWRLDKQSPGQGQPVYDLLLDFEAWKVPVTDCSLVFRNCTQNDMGKVLQLVEAETTRDNTMGWFDQYYKLIDDVNVGDIVLALEGSSILAVALTYTSSCYSPLSLDLPWASQIGDDCGGVSCICIPGGWLLWHISFLSGPSDNFY